MQESQGVSHSRGVMGFVWQTQLTAESVVAAFSGPRDSPLRGCSRNRSMSNSLAAEPPALRCIAMETWC